MRKKLKLFIASLVFGGFATVGITACGVMPTPVSIDEPDETQQDEMINTLFETKYLDASLDVKVKYQKEDQETPDSYHLYGDMLVDIASLDNIMADASLHLDMNDPQKTDEKHRLPIINLDFTYLDSFAYVSVNERNLKIKTDDFGTILEIIMGEDSGEKEQEVESSINNLSSTGVAELINNLAHMSYEDKGTYYEFISKTTENQPDLVVTTDTNFKITSLNISGIKYNDFTIDVKMNTTVLDELENPIVSPETAQKKFIDVSTYFGAFKKLRKILDDERFSMSYLLELRHYEPATPQDKVYLGYTDGDLSMDMKRTVLDIRGEEIVINDPATEGHDDYKTSYQAQYFDENIYLAYNLNRKDDAGNPMDYKLSYSNAGLADMWDLLGDDSVLGINFFDLIFGASDKEYPIIDIITDAAYRNITEYTQINFTDEYIELDIDNYLLGGKGHGSIKIYVDDFDEERSKPGIKSITIKDLDINSYIVDGELSFKEYVPIVKVNPDEYSKLDNLDKLIRSGAAFVRNEEMEYALGVDVSVKFDTKNEATSVVTHNAIKLSGDVQLNMDKTTVDEETKYSFNAAAGKLDVDYNGDKHGLKLQSRLDTVDNQKVNNIYVDYTYLAKNGDTPLNVKAKASYDSLLSIFETVMNAMTSTSEEPVENSTNTLGAISPFIEGATLDTISKVMNGDYFAVLRDEVIKNIEVNNDVYTIVIDKEMLGLNADLVIILAMEGTDLNYIRVTTDYNGYALDAKLTLKKYNGSVDYIGDASEYYAADSVAALFDYVMERTYSNRTFSFLAQFSNIMETGSAGLDFSGEVYKGNEKLFQVDNGSLDAHLRPADKDKKDESFLDRLDIVASASMKSEFDEGGLPTKELDLLLGYKDDKLAAKLGDAVKVYCSKEELKGIIEEVDKLINGGKKETPSEDTPDTPETQGTSIAFPIFTLFNQGNYQALLEMIEGLEVKEGSLVVTLSNGLFTSSETSSFKLYITADMDGLQSIKVDGLKLMGYEFRNLEVTLRDYVNRTITPVEDGYLHIGNLSKVVAQIDKILNSKKLGLDVFVTYNGMDIVLNNSQVSLNENRYAVDMTIDGEEYIHKLYDEHDEYIGSEKRRDVTSIRIENLGTKCEIVYQRGYKILSIIDSEPDTVVMDGEPVKIYINQSSIDNIVESVQSMLAKDGLEGRDKSYLYVVLQQYLGNLTGSITSEATTPDDPSEDPAETTSGGFDYASIIYKDYVQSMDYHDGVLTIVINANELGLDVKDDVITLQVTFSDKHEITNIHGDAIFLNTDNTVVPALVTENNAVIDVTIKEYDGNVHVITDEDRDESVYSWVGASSLENVVTYLDTIPGEAQEKMAQQVTDLIKQKTLGLSYNITIGKKASTPLITTRGNLDIDLSKLDFDNILALDDVAIGITDGVIINEQQGLNATYDLRVVKDPDLEKAVAYFKYAHDTTGAFKVKYTLNGLQDLMDLIEEEAKTNPTLSQFINSLMPGGTGESNDFNTALSTGDYVSLMKHYKNAYVDEATNILYIVFDGEMIGNEGNIEIGLDWKAGKGINSIHVKDFYAFGYYLSGTFTLDPTTKDHPGGYTVPTRPTDYDTYQTLDHINDILEDILDLFGTTDNKQVGYSVRFRYGDDLLLDADANFILKNTAHDPEEQDTNDGTVIVKFSSGTKTHYLQADVSAALYQHDPTYKAYQTELAELMKIDVEERTDVQKDRIKELKELSQAIVDAAADDSLIHFAYGDVDADTSGTQIEHGAYDTTEARNNRMYGRFTLGTVGDIWNLVQEVTSSGNARFANIMSMFSTEEGAKSVFSEILSGDIEAFLYNKVVKSFVYDDVNKQYVIVVNGDIFKVQSTDRVGDITLTLALKDKPGSVTGEQVIKSIGLAGVYEGKDIEATLSANDYVAPTKIVPPASEFEFSTLDDMAGTILNLAKENDFVFSGSITLNFNFPKILQDAIGIKNTPMPLDAKLHIETDPFGYENITGLVTFDNVSEVPYISEDTYATYTEGGVTKTTRVFNIYIENIVVYDEASTPYRDKKGKIVKDKDGNEIYYRPRLDSNGEVVRDTNVCLEVKYQPKGKDVWNIKRTRLSLDEFMTELPYYIVNYGFGIKKHVQAFAGAVNIDTSLHSTEDQSSYTPTYSTVLKSYSYNPATLEWNALVDTNNLMNNNLLKDLTLKIKAFDLNADDDTKKEYLLLDNLYASLGVTDYMTAVIDVDYDYYDNEGHINTISQAEIDAIHEYVQLYKGVVSYNNFSTTGYTSSDLKWNLDRDYIAIA